MPKNDGFDIPGKDSPKERRKIFAAMIAVTQDHLGVYGGYVYDSRWFGNKYVVAALDNSKDRNRTELETYSKRELIELANERIADYGDGWVNETIESAFPY